MKKSFNYFSKGIILIILLCVFMYRFTWNLNSSDKTQKKEVVRDRFWAWAHMEGVYNGGLFGLKDGSKITPIEGANYLGLSNLIFIRYNELPKPPFEQYAASLKPLKRIYWSVAGAGGVTSKEERDDVLKLAGNMKNIDGVFLDDFFNDKGAAIPIEQLQDIRKNISNIGGKKLDLGVTLYTYQLNDQNITPYMEQCDVISLWTWRSKDLVDLEYNFAKLKKMLPKKRVLLGIYMWDFGDKKPMPADLMKKQCELGLKWLKSGEIEGMIFLGTNICDLNIEAVKWTKEWIAKVGDEKL